MNDENKTRQVGVVERFLDKISARGIVSFSLQDILLSTGLSEIAARHQLLRLRERVIRVTPRQGFFLISSPEQRVFGAPPVDLWLNDYFTWLGSPYYLGLQSAAAVHGSSPQAIQETQVITDIPRDNILFSRIRINFFTKTNVSKSKIQQVQNAAAPLLVSTPETTALDLVRYANSIGGFERAIETILPLIPLMRARPLRETLEAEGELASAQRLGYILTQADATNLAEIIADWLPKYKKNVPLALGLTIKHDAPVDKTYGVILNIQGDANNAYKA